MAVNTENYEPKRIVENHEHSLYVAYQWDKGSAIPRAAVLFYDDANGVMCIAQVIVDNWATLEEAQMAAEAVAHKWLWDNSSNNWSLGF